MISVVKSEMAEPPTESLDLPHTEHPRMTGARAADSLSAAAIEQLEKVFSLE